MVGVRVRKLLALGVLFAGILATTAGCGVITPTQDILIKNDTSRWVQISGCGSDPVALNPGEEGPAEVSAGGKTKACDVYNSDTVYIGCLMITADASTVNKVSDFKRYVRESQCL
jgi:hypothetical protein